VRAVLHLCLVGRSFFVVLSNEVKARSILDKLLANSPFVCCNTSRSFADVVAGKLDDKALKALYRGLPKKRAAGHQRLLKGLQAAQPQWLLFLRCVSFV